MLNNKGIKKKKPGKENSLGGEGSSLAFSALLKCLAQTSHTYQHMPPQGGHVGEGSLASPALVRLFSSVDSLVTPQGSLLSEGLPTLLTEIRWCL